MDFHEDLHRIGAKEGLKGRKLQKAMESYAWNITVLKVSPRLALASVLSVHLDFTVGTCSARNSRTCCAD